MSVPVAQIVQLNRSEAGDMQEALAAAGLPHDDFGPALQLFALRSDDRPSAWAGLEPAGSDALLRSVVVRPEARGCGLGRQIVSALTSRARLAGTSRLWLLTDDAAGYFGKLGFEAVPRSSAPPEIQLTSQFSAGCCASAICMVLDLMGPDEQDARVIIV